MLNELTICKLLITFSFMSKHENARRCINLINCLSGLELNFEPTSQTHTKLDIISIDDNFVSWKGLNWVVVEDNLMMEIASWHGCYQRGSWQASSLATITQHSDAWRPLIRPSFKPACQIRSFIPATKHLYFIFLIQFRITNL